MSPTSLFRRLAGVFPKQQLKKIIPEPCGRKQCFCVARMKKNDSKQIHAIFYSEYKKCVKNSKLLNYKTIKWTTLKD
jgi:hypothetical protein